jgi:hypothetical protein
MLADCGLVGVTCPMGIDSRCPKRVIHDRVEPATGQAMSAIPRLRPIFAVPSNFAMCTNGDIIGY